MGRFAPVAPLEIVKELEERNVLGDYHLLLAHDVLANREEYSNIFGGKGYDIIMDNSLIELGYPMSMPETMEAAKVVGASYFVLPDVLMDYDRTMAMTVKGLQEYDRIKHERPSETQLPTPVPVVQGKNLDEMVNFISELDKINRMHNLFEMFCVPRVIANQLGTRRDIIEACVARGYVVHMLGFSDHKLDDIACARMPSVMGIDSAEPVRLGINGYNMSLDFPRDPGPRKNYWNSPLEGKSHQAKETALAMAAFNCGRFREWIEPKKV